MKLRLNIFDFLLCLVAFCLGACSNHPSSERRDDSGASDQAIETILKDLTLEDKVGEMTQFSIDVLSVGKPYELEEPHQFDEERLKHVLLDLKAGSILNVGGHAYTLEYWHQVIKRIQDIATKEKKSGIPVLYGIDAIHGTNYTIDATLFPQQIGLAATWNPDLAYEMGRITAYETRASWIPWTFSPVLDMGRDPRWPRMWETFGEDVLLAAKMGAATVKGYQGEDVSDKESIAACMKHFLGYGTPHSGKDRTASYIPMRQLQEYHVPTFQKAIEAGAKTIMINSGELNGIPVHASKEILTDLLRHQMGFEGLVLTDWEDIKYLVSRHRVASTHKEAIKMAILAGIDMSMVPMDTEFPILLKELVEEGAIPMARIDESVRRILKLKFELGLFDNPYPKDEVYPKFASEEHRQASLKTAQESITLLKNKENILPLKKDRKILVAGPTANTLRALNGGWTGTWQGDEEQYFTKGKATVLQAIKDKVGATKVRYVEGSSYDKTINVKEAALTAKWADVAIVCLGELSYTEKPGDIDDLRIPEAQRILVEAIHKTGTPVVLVLLEGRPRIITAFEGLPKAIVQGYLPGNEGGIAIADILFGEVNPSGKLPYTYPKYVNNLLTYDHKWTDRYSLDYAYSGFKPLYEFGHGMSYSTFEYSDLSFSSNTLEAADSLDITVKVKNTSERVGKEVVQLFIADKVASITPSHKRLRDFQKIELQAGESRTLSFQVKAKDLGFVGQDNKWIAEAGMFEVQLAELRDSFRLVKTIVLD